MLLINQLEQSFVRTVDRFKGMKKAVGLLLRTDPGAGNVKSA